MPPRVKNAASDWGAIGIAIATALAGTFSMASLPARFDELKCRLDALNARIEAVERREALAAEWRRIDKRPEVSRGDIDLRGSRP